MNTLKRMYEVDVRVGRRKTNIFEQTNFHPVQLWFNFGFEQISFVLWRARSSDSIFITEPSFRIANSQKSHINRPSSKSKWPINVVHFFFYYTHEYSFCIRERTVLTTYTPKYVVVLVGVQVHTNRQANRQTGIYMNYFFVFFSRLLFIYFFFLFLFVGFFGCFFITCIHVPVSKYVI